MADSFNAELWNDVPAETCRRVRRWHREDGAHEGEPLIHESWRMRGRSRAQGRPMENLCRYAHRPLAFLFRYIRQRPISHAVILAAVLGAVGCAVSTQYGVKFLVDTLSGMHAA